MTTFKQANLSQKCSRNKRDDVLLLVVDFSGLGHRSSIKARNFLARQHALRRLVDGVINFMHLLCNCAAGVYKFGVCYTASSLPELKNFLT